MPLRDFFMNTCNNIPQQGAALLAVSNLTQQRHSNNRYL